MLHFMSYTFYHNKHNKEITEKNVNICKKLHVVLLHLSLNTETESVFL